MSKSNKIAKTIDRKLRDLDDHLYFLKDSLSKLSKGDHAYIKNLSEELRVLVCKASGTEGLLWRVIDELSLQDVDYVHLAGNVELECPITDGLQFHFAPILRADQSDPRFISAQYSLKKIIKEYKAVVASSVSFTHENLIRAVAEQMGSGHEDDGVRPELVELSGAVISNQAILNAILISEADLVLEVGERVLAKAFKRTPRLEIILPDQPIKAYSDRYTTDFIGGNNSLSSEGTIFFTVCHPHKDWLTNNNRYDFGLHKQGPLSIRTVKHPDKTIEIIMEGFTENILISRNPIPTSTQPGVTVICIVWNKDNVSFYIDAVCVDVCEYGIKG